MLLRLLLNWQFTIRIYPPLCQSTHRVSNPSDTTGGVTPIWRKDASTTVITPVALKFIQSRLIWKLTWGLTRVRSPTSAPGRAATGGLRGRTSWPATTGSTRVPSRSSAGCATAASPAPTTWRCTWSDTRTERCADCLTPRSPLCHPLNRRPNFIYKKRKRKEKTKELEMYILYIWGHREYIVFIPKCLVILRTWKLAVMLTAGFSPANFISRQAATSQHGEPVGAHGVRMLFLCRLHTLSLVTLFSINKPVDRHPTDCQDFTWHGLVFFFFSFVFLFLCFSSRLDYFHSGGTQCTWQFTNSHWTNVFCFCFVFLYELPIFAIQNFVNTQISFIGLLQVFKDCLGGGYHTSFENNYEYM